jgi:hypothetical protein
MDQILRFEEFAPIFSRELGRGLDQAAFLGGITDGTLDFNDKAFRQALYEYLTGWFPELDIGWDYFEQLRYERVDIPHTLLQLSQANYLDGLAVPPEVPSNFFFGRNDEILSLTTEEGRGAYRERILSLIPHAQIHECEIDHYGRGPDHDPVIEKLGDLFEERETRGISRDRDDKTATLGDIRR